MVKQIVVGAVLLIIVGLFIAHYYENSNRTIKVLQRTEMYEHYDSKFKNVAHKGYIDPASNVKILQLHYGKDFMSIKVTNQNNQVGWVIYNRKVILFE